MPLTYNGTTIGKVVIKQDENKFTIQIRQGNCLAVLIYPEKIIEGKHAGMWRHTLYMFFGDEQHLKNMMKEYGNVIPDKVVSAELNLYYKECWTLLKYFTRSGYKVKCYYKEPKQSKSKE